MKNNDANKNLKAELEKRIAVRENLKDADKIKRELRKAGDIDSLAGGSTDYEIESLGTIGKSDNELVNSLTEALNEFLEKVGEYAFGSHQLKRYFPGNKLLALVKAMKSAGLDLESRYVMDIFKTRVKERSGGKVPTIKERKGMFGGSSERQMKSEEIVQKYEVEVDIPKDGKEVAPLTAVGTQKGIMKHLNDSLLHNEEIEDPFKKGPRKTVAKFMQAVKLLNPSANDPNEKMFIAALLTPDSVQPKSGGDKELIEKLTTIFKRGSKWLDTKIQASENQQSNENPQQKEA